MRIFIGSTLPPTWAELGILGSNFEYTHIAVPHTEFTGPVVSAHMLVMPFNIVHDEIAIGPALTVKELQELQA